MIKKPKASMLSRVTATLALVATACFTVADEGGSGALTPSHGIAMHGELKYPEGFSHFDYVNPEAPKGGELKLSVVANGFDSFNPFVIRGISAVGVNAYVYDSLLDASADEPFSEYGLIAETVEVPDDRSFVVFNLNKDARFQDGAPITAEDVEFSYRILTTEGHPFYRNYYADVEKVTIENSHRIRFDFAQTNNRELALILGQMPVLPKHFWADRDFSSSGLTTPVGSGPYRIDSYDAGRSVTYERVDDYWAADLGVRKGRYNFDKISYEYYNDDTVALEAFKAGNFDFRLETSAKNWATAYTGRQFETGSIEKKAIEHQRPTGMQGFIFNTRRAAFKDPKVREALAYGFDFQWANQNLFFGQYTRTRSFFENSELASTGLPEGRELDILEPFRDQLAPAVFNKAYTPPDTGEGASLRDNLRTALQLLTEAGYKIENGKMVHQETGKPLSFEILLFQKTFERVVLPFRNNLAKLGIDVSVRLVDSNQYIQRVRNFDFDVISQVLPQSDSPGNEQRDYWHSSNAGEAGSRNAIGVNSPVVDELIDLVIQAPDREELVYRVRALDRVLLNGHYVVPHWHLRKDRVAYWSHLKRPDTTPKNGIDLNNWWIER
ncbi:extracellular solute-binding protein [Marinobacter daepoensis]|uniref:ABC transporter substrate-binding protein n=2 Tax=Marinobacter daepoensis TaxID=262077 RepID=A0ABS3BC89_9GAMM|nr:ABC transporter substrate-binding protein [Marinobacter daepoensis]MBY6032425.1 extracellular solute-binding protein [Marinobacter daepoensis]MBY6077660.1 extracellular solute-binding protein [Marinobacter daepoensis]